MSEAEREPVHVRHDLMRKAGADTVYAIQRSSTLLGHPVDQLEVAIGGVAGALACAIETWCRAHGQPIRSARDLHREKVREIGIWIIERTVEGWPAKAADPKR
ncbi:hypothetical protein FHP25_24835 [Vineibacter terrae]|uniref:Uncharacterized protein n=1 Tax=Vineibacter terrae TaxID=2586908 RepID=A0A5C8PGV1_9HYPH|nr:hypothetical protein [Vineibacter terrae]TXL72524.1 hypothetical protein FHP25_24835 [Vineibacter terrae]